MKSRIFLIPLLLALAGAASAHDVITTKITFDREIIRIVQARCASCHREGGSAFSLLNYSEARPWAKAMQEEVLERRMPPWGAVKGFGDFRNDQALTPEQIELVANWVEGGSPEGEPKDLPEPPKEKPLEASPHSPPHIAAGPDYKLTHPLNLAGVWPSKVTPNASFQVTAELPDGSIQPLLWLQPFKPAYNHAFWFRNPLLLPRGTVIRGIEPGSAIDLLPAHRSE
jgi:hypothetical protein